MYIFICFIFYIFIYIFSDFFYFFLSIPINRICLLQSVQGSCVQVSSLHSVQGSCVSLRVKVGKAAPLVAKGGLAYLTIPSCLMPLINKNLTRHTPSAWPPSMFFLLGPGSGPPLVLDQLVV